MSQRYKIKEIGRLGLGFKTKITDFDPKTGEFETALCGELEDGLEIYLWAEDFSHRWVIASFDFNKWEAIKDKKERCFELTEIGDRLANPDINWEDLHKLYAFGRSILDVAEDLLD